MAFSCAKVEERAIFDTSSITPPVLVSADYDEEENELTAQFTAATFVRTFNEKMNTYHTLAIVGVDGKAANATLVAKESDNTLTVSGKSITNVLKGRGYAAHDVVSVDIVVRASIQDPSQGITNAYADSEDKYNFSIEMPEEGSPYEQYTELSDWSLTGAMSVYEINWNADLNMWTDGKGNHVAAHVTLKAGDKVKFRKDLGWDVNMGGTMESVGAAFPVSQGGADIVIPTDGIYDLFLDLNANTATIAAAYDPLADYTEASTWGVTGALPDHGINWDKDIPMLTDGKGNHVALSVSIGADDKFKFRKDGGWDVNYGGVFSEVGSEFPVTQGGSDIAVGVKGIYDLYLNPDAATAIVAEPSGLKVSSVIVPEVYKPEAWSLVGTIGESNWDKDFDLENVSGDVWTIKQIEFGAKTEFKIRADYKWDISYGGSEANAKAVNDKGEEYDVFTPTLGLEFKAGGLNILIAEAGVYNVTLTYGDEPTILIEEYKEFPEHMYMTGTDFGSWNWAEGTVELVPVYVTDTGAGEGQFWTIRYLTAGNGVKFNSALAWNGGQFGSLGTNEGFTNDKDGNVQVAESGIYMIHIDLKRDILHVEPARVYGIGDCFGGWTEGIEDALFAADGQTLKTTLATGGEIRMYAASTIANTDWWTREFVFFDGKIAYRGKGGDQERVKLSAAQTVTLNFNEGTASVEGEGEAPTLPQTMYIIGEAINGWNDFVPMHPFHSQEGMFWIIRYLEGGKQFKFSPVADWKGDFYQLDSNEGFEVDGTNCKVAESGIYCIGVDCDGGRIIVEPAKVYGIGEAFGGWGATPVLFQVQDNTLVGTCISEGDIRTYVDSKLLTSTDGSLDWWHAEFIPKDGQIVYRETGGDPDAVSISIGERIVYDFNAGTGVVIDY